MGSSTVKGLARHLALVAFLCLPVGVAAGQGCTLANDICDVFCECEHCNDRQEDECLIRVAQARDTADEYECAEESDEFWECALDRNDCDDANWSIDDGCADELADLTECIDDNSDIIGSVQANVAQGPPPDAVDGPSGTVCACTCTCTMACSVGVETRNCGPGEGGCESCDVVCADACLADAACGTVDTSDGQCTPG